MATIEALILLAKSLTFNPTFLVGRYSKNLIEKSNTLRSSAAIVFPCITIAVKTLSAAAERRSGLLADSDV